MEANANSKKFMAIASCAWASHFISLWGGFVFDDSEAIVKNKDILPSTPLQFVFTNDFWGTNISLNSSHKSYRPLTVLSYRLNMFFSNSRLDAFQFHTANVVLHGILSIMTLPFFECLLKRRKHRKSLAPLDDPAFTGALLFATHPVHSEAVAALVGRADILAALLFLSLIILYKIPSGNVAWFFVVTMFTGAAVLCKETAITVLGFCLLYEVYLRKKPSKPWGDVLSQKILVRFGLLTLVGAVVMFLRLKVMNFEGPTFSHTDNPAAFADRLFTRVFSYSYVYSLNAMLLIWPQWLCFDWSMGCIPLIETITDFRVVPVICFWLLGVTAACKMIKDSASRDKIDVSVIGASLVVIPFLPSSNLLLKVGFVVAERTLLLPSAGCCLLVALGLEKLKNRYDHIKIMFTTMYILLIATFIVRSMYRNYEWVNEDRLFKSALHVCPLNAKVHYNIAKVAADQGKKDEALRSYRKALELYPNYEQAMNNLANLLRESGQLEEAEILLRSAVKVRPNFAAAWMNLGIVLSGKGFIEEAESAYKTALKYRKRYSDAQYNLGNLYLDLGRHDEALSSWREAVRLRPSHAAAWGNALALLDSEGRAHEAVEFGALALHHVPRAPSIHFAMGNALGKLNRFPEAESHFLQAIKLNETNALYYSNLGVLYHRWERRDKAEQMYLKALKLDPNLNSARANLRKLESTSNNAHSKNHSKRLSTSKMAPIVERIPEIPNLELGEGPHWDAETQSLYFVDIFGKSIHKYIPSTGQHTKAVFDKPVSIIIPVKGKRDQFVVSVQRDICKISWDGNSEKPSEIEKIAEVDSGTENRLNDGKCDPTGRLWVGTMGPEPENGYAQPESGSLFSLTNGKINTHLTKLGISNGLAWNTQLKKCYFIDSFAGSVDAFDYDGSSGTISNRTPVFTLSKNGIDGFPDGMTIDVDGNLWVAVFNGYRVIKIDPRKPETLLQTIDIPAKQVTSVAFGGIDLDILYVTSASFTIDGEELLPPNHGAVFKVTGLGTRGLSGDGIIL